MDIGRASRSSAAPQLHRTRCNLPCDPALSPLTRGKLAMRAGFLVDRVVAWGRNSGVPASLRLPGGRVVSRATAIQRFPGLKRQGLTGAAVFYDYLTLEPDRLTFSYGQAAVGHGAVLANHVEAIAPLLDGRRVTGITARDVLGARTFEIAARLTVNATGGAVDRLLAPLGTTARVPMLKAMNLVTKRDAGDEALGGRSLSGRNLFLVPWREHALFGTWESGRVCDSGDAGVAEADVAAFIGELNQAFPSLDLSMADVTLVHRGVVPAAVHGDQVVLQGHEQIRDHAAEGIDGLLTVAGTKYTTARAVAERVTATLLASSSTRRWRAMRRHAAAGRQRARLGVGDCRRQTRRFDEGCRPTLTIHLIAACGSRYRVCDGSGRRPAGVAHARRAGVAGDRRAAGAGGTKGNGAHARRRRHPPDTARRARMSNRRCPRARRRHRRRRAGLVREPASGRNRRRPRVLCDWLKSSVV